MRVCHIIHGLGAGGAEQLLVDLARASVDSALDMCVIAITDAAGAVHHVELRELGVRVETLGLPSPWDLRRVTRSAMLVREFRPDILHTHMKHADLIGAVLASRFALPQVSTLHVIEDSVTGLGVAKRWLAGQVRQRAARTIAVSEAQRQWYLDAFSAAPDQVVTVHNGVVRPPVIEAEQRAHLRARLCPDPQIVLAACVAIMRPGKGHEDLLAALSRIPETIGLRVVLVGDGSERANLERLARADPRIGGRVIFTGYRTDVSAILDAVDFVIHPSHAEALPTSLIQALAAARPVVATDVGGIPEVVTDDCGVLVRVADIDGLARQTTRLATDPALRRQWGLAGQRRFDEHFEASWWVQRLESLYAEVVARSLA